MIALPSAPDVMPDRPRAVDAPPPNEPAPSAPVAAPEPGAMWAETVIRAHNAAPSSKEVAINLRTLREPGKPDVVCFDFGPEVGGDTPSEQYLTGPQFNSAFALLQQAVAYGRQIGVLPPAEDAR